MFCTGLTAIPLDLFANNVNATSFRDTFWGCTSLRGDAPQLWITHPNANENSPGCFRDATALSNWGSIPSSWGGGFYEWSVDIIGFSGDIEWDIEWSDIVI
jgi:hypothetical protein